MKFYLSQSTDLKGSKDGAYSSEGVYTYGKATTFGYRAVELDWATLIGATLFTAVSPYIYKNGARNEKSITGVGNVLMFDIDSDRDITEPLLVALAKADYQWAIVPTQNHGVVIGTKTMCKYRLLIPIDGAPTVAHYRASLYGVVATLGLPEVDGATYDIARFYAPAIPKAGQRFNHTSNKDNKPFVVTEAIEKEHMARLGMADGNYTYPNNIQSPNVLQYTEELGGYMPAEIVEEDDTYYIDGTTLSRVFKQVTNTMYKPVFNVMEREHTLAIGDIAGGLGENERVQVLCPSADLHTDPNDERYAWLLKTSRGITQLRCSSNHCRQEHGDVRVVRLPPWNTFVDPAHAAHTGAYCNSTYHGAVSLLNKRMVDSLCIHYGVSALNYHEKVAHTEKAMFVDLFDSNGLMLFVMCLNTSSRSQAGHITTLTPSGQPMGNVNVKNREALVKSWGHHVFKDGYSAFYDKVRDKEMAKGKILTELAQYILSDAKFVMIERQAYDVKPHLTQQGTMTVAHDATGKTVTIVSSRFDEPLYTRLKDLDKKGVHGYEQYSTVVEQFRRNWTLPHGSVMLGETEIKDLPTLLMVFGMLNMYSEAKSNQRHTAFVIQAPSGMGKTSLIKNFHTLGLTNDDSFQADVFGFDGLYPNSVRPLVNKLFVTGDELSPTLMKRMSVPALLGNLTRSHIHLNVKHEVDSSFGAFAKVLWGAGAYDAIDNIPQSAELRNRLFLLQYDSGHVDEEFMTTCAGDYGFVDDIVQHHLATQYIGLKAQLRTLSVEDTLLAFNGLRTSLIKMYAGVKSRTVGEDEFGNEVILTEDIEQDGTRHAKGVLRNLLEWRHNVLTNPSGEGGPKASIEYSAMSVNRVTSRKMRMPHRRLQLCEELMVHYDGILVIPSKVSKAFITMYETICDNLAGNDQRRAYAMKRDLSSSVMEVNKLLKTAGVEEWRKSDIDTKVKTLYVDERVKTETQGMALSYVSIDKLNTLIGE